MSDFNEDAYLQDMGDADSLKGDSASSQPSPGCSNDSSHQAEKTSSSRASDDAGKSQQAAQSEPIDSSVSDMTVNDTSEGVADTNDASEADEGDTDPGLPPLGKAKKEAADYLEALQRERASFVNFRNRAAKEQERFREHGIIDVLTALLPALDDLDRVNEHGDLPDSLKPVIAKIDKVFAGFKVEKFGQKGEDFDPTKHEAILHKPDPDATKETVDTVVEAGYRIGDRVIRAARVVVVSPSNGAQDDNK